MYANTQFYCHITEANSYGEWSAHVSLLPQISFGITDNIISAHVTITISFLFWGANFVIGVDKNDH